MTSSTIIKNIGLKLAERNHQSYSFYPNAIFRGLGFILLFVCYSFGFIYFFLKDFQLNIGLTLYLLVCTIICFTLIILSFNSITILNSSGIVKIRSLFRKNRQIPIKNIHNIYRYTKTEEALTSSRYTERSTRFYLYLNNEEKIRLTPKIIDEPFLKKSFLKTKYGLIDKFDTLIYDLANDLNLQIVVKEEKPDTEKENKYTNILLSGFILMIALFYTPIWWLAYAIILSSILFMTKGKTISDFIISVTLFYLLTALIISTSPYLRIKDFQLFHPNYKASEFNITHFEGKYRSQYKSIGYYYATIDYTYEKNGKTYQQQEEEAIKWGHFTDNSQKNKAKINQLLKENECFVFVNANNPTESKLFCSNKYLYLEGSRAYYFFQDLFSGFIGIISFSGIMFGIIFLTQRKDYLFLTKIQNLKIWQKIATSFILGLIGCISMLFFIRIIDFDWLFYKKIIVGSITLPIIVTSIISHIIIWLPNIKKSNHHQAIAWIIFVVLSQLLSILTFYISVLLVMLLYSI